MAKKNLTIAIPHEVLMSKIREVRGEKVMLDRDLAALYGVETRVLKQAVRRNLDRFPEDFMFEMDKEEFQSWRSQSVMSKEDRKGLRYAPFCFTEQGVAMLSSILNSPTAIQVNIQIMRLFTKMRQLISSHQEFFKQLEEIRSSVRGHDDQLQIIFEYLKQFEAIKQQELDQQNRQKIGYKRGD
jgi:hypothetical protein